MGTATREEYEAFHEEIADQLGTDRHIVALIRQQYFDNGRDFAKVVKNLSERVTVAEKNNTRVKRWWKEAWLLLSKLNTEDRNYLVKEFKNG